MQSGCICFDDGSRGSLHSGNFCLAFSLSRLFGLIVVIILNFFMRCRLRPDPVASVVVLPVKAGITAGSICWIAAVVPAIFTDGIKQIRSIWVGMIPQRF